MEEQIKFISSNGIFIKRLDYICERDSQYHSFVWSHIIFHGSIHFCSSKEIDFNKPFCISMIDIKNICVTNINNIWLTNINYSTINSEYFEYEAKFQAENVKYGNLKNVYLTFLKK